MWLCAYKSVPERFLSMVHIIVAILTSDSNPLVAVSKSIADFTGVITTGGVGIPCKSKDVIICWTSSVHDHLIWLVGRSIHSYDSPILLPYNSCGWWVSGCTDQSEVIRCHVLPQGSYRRWSCTMKSKVIQKRIQQYRSCNHLQEYPRG